MICAAALAVALPSRFRVDLDHEGGTSLITVSVKPLFFPYLIIFKQRRETKMTAGEALVHWVLSLIENRSGAKHKKKAMGGKGPSQELPSWKVPSRKIHSGMSFSGGPPAAGQSSGSPKSQVSSGSKGGYRDLLDEARRIMVVEELVVRAKIGFDDACATAVLCGALQAIRGMLPNSRMGPGRWDVRVMPVYQKSHFALKAKLVVRVSLLNGIRLVIFAKHLLKKR